MDTVLLTSAGTDSFPAVYNALKSVPKGFRVMGCDMRKEAFGLHLADRGCVVPRREDEGFIPRLLEICKEESVSYIFPLCPDDQPVLVANKSAFDKLGITLIASDPETVRRASDNILLHQLCTAQGIGAGEYYVCQTMADVEQAAAALGYPRKKIVLKRRTSAGGQGVRLFEYCADNHKMFWKQSSMIDSLENFYYHFKDVNLAKVLGDFIIEEFLPGQEYSVDLISDKKGKVVQSVVRERFQSIGGLALHAEIVDSDDVKREAETLAAKLGLAYINNIQFKRNRAGKPCIMEINPRIPGTLCLTTESGVNMPYMAIGIARDQMVEPMLSRKMGIIRYYTGVYYAT